MHTQHCTHIPYTSRNHETCGTCLSQNAAKLQHAHICNTSFKYTVPPRCNFDSHIATRKMWSSYTMITTTNASIDSYCQDSCQLMLHVCICTLLLRTRVSGRLGTYSPPSPPPSPLPMRMSFWYKTLLSGEAAQTIHDPTTVAMAACTHTLPVQHSFCWRWQWSHSVPRS